MNDDLISRQAAIDALERLKRDISGDYTNLDPLVMAGTAYIGDCIEELQDLPSAQPYTDEEIQKIQELEQAEIQKAFQLGREDALSEIIRCKECKHSAYCYSEVHMLNRFRSTSICKDIEFCSYAERRTDG